MFSVKLQHVLVPREKDGSDVEDKGFEFEALLGSVCVCVCEPQSQASSLCAAAFSGWRH